MSTTRCNPGRWLLYEGSLELSYSENGLGGPGWHPQGAHLVTDSDTDDSVTLANLLRQFLEDPAETITGPIRITIEATS